MSYLRWGSILHYVKGESQDYIYGTRNGRKYVIVDYGKISDAGLVELIARHLSEGDALIKKYLLWRLAARLKVEMRKRPLTEKQAWKRIASRDKKLMKEHTKLMKEHAQKRLDSHQFEGGKSGAL